METRKNLINLFKILCLGLLMVGCSSKNISSNNVSLDFLVSPEQLRIHSNAQLEKLNEVEAKAMMSTESLNEKYDDTSTLSEENIKIQEEIGKEVTDVLNQGKVVENKGAIENIFNQLRDLEGVYVDSFEEEVKSKIELIEDPETSSWISLENSYLRMFMLLEDGSILIPKSKMESSTNEIESTGKIEYIKLKLPENLKVELEELTKD